MMRHPAPALLAAILLIAGCTRGDKERTAAVPLPKAWPRTDLYDTAYVAARPGSDIHVNAGASVTTAEGGLTVAYPRYRASLFISDTPARSDADAAGILANRLERIDLNIGGLRTEVSEMDADNGYSLRIFTTPSGSITPLQFIAAADRRIVSGALVMDRIPASADSLAPTLRAVTRDIIHLATNLDD